MEVNRWPPAAVFPASAPTVGVRADRHDELANWVAYKIWVTDDAVETAVYRPTGRDAVVPAFLQEVRDAAARYLSNWAERARGSDGELVDDWDQMDVSREIDPPFVGGEGPPGIGMSRRSNIGTGRHLRTSDLLTLMVEDVDARLAAS